VELTSEVAETRGEFQFNEVMDVFGFASRAAFRIHPRRRDCVERSDDLPCLAAREHAGAGESMRVRAACAALVREQTTVIAE
jgi:hypothetical protein